MQKIKKILESPLGIILLATLLVFLAMGSPFPFRKSLSAAFFFMLNYSALTLVLPLMVIWFLLKKPLSAFGWALPQSWKKSALPVFVSIIVWAPVVIYFSGRYDFRYFYLVSNLSTGAQLMTNIIIPALVYFSLEFLFRGFLFRGLFNKIGYHSFWITNIIYATFHVTAPPLEIVFAFFAGMHWSYLSLKTKSFIPAFLSHFAIAVIFEVIIAFSGPL